jgi:adenylate kinase
MRISITGTPGTGKHRIGKAIAKQFNLEFVDLGKLAMEKNIVTPDLERETNIVDISALQKLTKNKENALFVGNFAELIPSDIVLVIRCSPEILKKRLIDREWSKSKIKENLLAEALGSCLISALNHNPPENVAEIDNSHDFEATLQTIIKIIQGTEKKTYGQIDYLSFAPKIEEDYL